MTLGDSENPTAAADLRMPYEEEFESAASHPIAAQALKMMLRRPTTPRDVAEVVGEPLEEVAKHLADLRSYGLITASGSREVEGRTESIYEGPFVPFLDSEEWGELESPEQRFHLTRIVRLLMSDFEAAVEAGTLDTWPDFHLCRIPFRMDERGWKEVQAVYDEALMRTLRIREEAGERLQRSGERGKRGTAGQLLFELPDVD